MSPKHSPFSYLHSPFSLTGDRIVVLAIAAILLSTLLLASGIIPLPSQPLCWSQLILGRDCPGCGLTRGFIAMARLEFTEAARLNPLAIPLFVFLLLQLVVRVFASHLERISPGLPRRITVSTSLMILATMTWRTVAFYLIHD